MKQSHNKPVTADLNIQQKEKGIKKIDTMLSKLSSFNINNIEVSDSRIRVLEDELDKLLIDIFGNNTIEQQRYSHISMLNTTALTPYEIDLRRIQEDLKTSIDKAIETLKSIRQGFNEDINDVESDKPSRILNAYNGLALHYEISKVSDDLYKDGHYAQAVEAAVKQLISSVKTKSGITDKDGTSLMQVVFTDKNPILKLNSLQSKSDSNQQLGYMELFTGVVRAIRNPRAHENIIDDPEEALEYIAFISHLAKRLDKTTK